MSSYVSGGDLPSPPAGGGSGSGAVVSENADGTTTLSVDTGALYERPPDRAQRAQYVRAAMVETLISNVPTLSCQGTNTARRQIKSVGMLHAEGGWPTSVDAAEADERIKYAKRLQREEAYLSAVAELLTRVTAPLRINAAMDIYSTHFDAAPTSASPSSSSRLNFAADGAGSTMDASQSVAQQQQQHGQASVATTSAAGGRVGAAYQLARVQYSPSDQAAMAVTCRLPPPPSIGGRDAARPATSLSWMYADASRAVAAYGNESGAADHHAAMASSGLAHDAGTASDESNKAMAAAYWDTASGGAHPISWLHSEAYITATTANPKDAFLIVAGTENGVVQVYDARVGRAAHGGGALADATGSSASSLKPTVFSSQLSGHSGRVAAVRCIVGKSLEFFSAGADGRVLFWDARNLAAPIDTTTLYVGSSSNASADSASAAATHSVSCLDFDPVNGASSKLLFGTSEGTVVLCSKSGTRSGGGGGDRIAARISAHYGPVMDVSRHPHMPKIFASVGDWGFSLFSEDLRTPISRSGFNPCRLVGGKWHPVRPSVFVTVASDGELAVWDIVLGIARPVMTTAVTMHGRPTHLALRADGRVAAVTDTAGGVSLVALPDVVSLLRDRSEKVAVVQLLDHETARERQHVAGLEAKARLTSSSGHAESAAAASVAAAPRRAAVTEHQTYTTGRSFNLAGDGPFGAAATAADDPSSANLHVDPETVTAVAKAAQDFLARARGSC